ncbi:hypothetical protein RUM44_002092 [Polyplax serrata]|uniref:Uncharacterized protein n=1 Tax=Polyplax serrata TaxID=468196 RepID=A0ABR1ALW9_POLSC
MVGIIRRRGGECQGCLTLTQLPVFPVPWRFWSEIDRKIRTSVDDSVKDDVLYHSKVDEAEEEEEIKEIVKVRLKVLMRKHNQTEKAEPNGGIHPRDANAE